MSENVLNGVSKTDPAGGGGGRFGLGWLALGALGVVFGDIGTSPLYAFKECFAITGHHPMTVVHDNILGVLSLITWSLFMVVSVKYINFVMRADNKGEGGTFALLALLGKTIRENKNASWLSLIAITGASLIYAESIITPAISVLSAMEGIGVYTDKLDRWIIPGTMGVLLALFLVQSRGTHKLGQAFGPIMLLWFVSIGGLGLYQIVENPHVLQSLNPYYAIQFFVQNKLHGVFVLGSVVLCITGCEALYADMGHFGAKPIRLGWIFVVFPCLLMNYFGQGAYVLATYSDPTSAPVTENFKPFFELIPTALQLPMVVLATAATIIASQAMISGVFSITRQAVLLGYLPRMNIIHTSADASGQIYIPGVNKLLMCGSLALVLIFKNSSNLAGAYGIAVTATMCMTSLLFYRVATSLWKWSRSWALPLVVLFLVFDVSFLLSNVLKLADGGWITVMVALIVSNIMVTWRLGRQYLGTSVQGLTPTVSEFMSSLSVKNPVRVSGTAVFMGGGNHTVPMALNVYMNHSGALQERVVILGMIPCDVPFVPNEERISVETLSGGFLRISAKFGFMEQPSVRRALHLAAIHHNVRVDMDDSMFFLGRESLALSAHPKLSAWRRELYSFISRNAWNAADYFEIPPDRAIEIGVRLEL